MKFLYYIIRIAAVLAFLNMLYCVGKAFPHGNAEWLDAAAIQGLLSVFFLYFSGYIKKQMIVDT